MIFCVKIDGIKAFGKHGVSDDERNTSQIFQIDLYYEYIVDNEKFEDNLDVVIDYRKIVDITISVVRNTSFKLLEMLSVEITDRIRAVDKIIGASIKIRKLSLNGYLPCDSLSIGLRDY